MNGLSLCAGAGGLDLGIEIAFTKYRCIAAVENNPEAAIRFKFRFPQVKVFEDVVRFDGRRLNGIVDSVSAGWPCQPHSVAGQRKGTSDERWIWDHIARIIGEVEPVLFFGENVAGILRDTDSNSGSGADIEELEIEPDEPIGGMGTVLRDLAEMGYITAWGMLRASQVGASHGRPRVFFLAVHPERYVDYGQSRKSRRSEGERSETRKGSGPRGYGLAHSMHSGSSSTRSEARCGSESEAGISSGSSGTMADDSQSRSGRIPESDRRKQVANTDRSQPELADTRRGHTGEDEPQRQSWGRAAANIGPFSGTMENTRCEYMEGTESQRKRNMQQPFTSNTSGQMARFDRDGVDGSGGKQEQPESSVANWQLGIFAPGPSSPDWPAILHHDYGLRPALSIFEQCLTVAIQQIGVNVQEETESAFRELVDGLASRLVQRRPQLQCIGNGVVPLCAATLFTVLARRLGIESFLDPL